MRIFALLPFIMGGTVVAPQDPVAQSTVLIIGKIARGTFTCSGTVIADDLVLTAGHCLGGPGYAKLDVYFRTDKDGSGPVLGVKHQIRPETYNTDPHRPWNDLALLRLMQRIPSNYHPVPLLSDPTWLQNGAPLILAGYGITVPIAPEFGAGGAGILRKTESKLLQSSYHENELLVDIHERGACFGDSGGPAYLQIGHDLVLAGVTSHLSEKNRLPDEGRRKRYSCSVDMIYTNVLALSAWIQKAISEIRAMP